MRAMAGSNFAMNDSTCFAGVVAVFVVARVGI
jgi:hypothetical protein